ncbi:MAG: helix-turn-helix domain-containing protein [Flavobacteriaceae bacterium]|nr:helix-turn-helix domain-containing protein [Flavobacteriaceae bacterium]
MPTTIVTTEDLMEFKLELLEEIKKLLNNQSGSGSGSKKWLKSTEVMKLLQISPGTLQNFRINGNLPFTRIGGSIYYDADEINKILMENRSNHKCE